MAIIPNEKAAALDGGDGLESYGRFPIPTDKDRTDAYYQSDPLRRKRAT
jgi:hypothetical protein